jgi:hypothetical protein
MYCTISPSHHNTLVATTEQELIMNTKISGKLAALGMALVMNGLILGVIAYLFDAEFLEHARTVAMAGVIGA